MVLYRIRRYNYRNIRVILLVASLLKYIIAGNNNKYLNYSMHLSCIGGDIGTLNYPSSKLSTCQDDCSADENCVGIEYTYNNGSYLCTLKNNQC